MRYKQAPATAESVIRVVNALYADFDRRREYINRCDEQAAKNRDGNPEPCFNKFRDLNMALESAVDVICEKAIRGPMMYDLKNDIGFNKSSLSLIMSHKTYYNRKRAVKLEAARRLGLI